MTTGEGNTRYPIWLPGSGHPQMTGTKRRQDLHHNRVTRRMGWYDLNYLALQCYRIGPVCPYPPERGWVPTRFLLSSAVAVWGKFTRHATLDWIGRLPLSSQPRGSASVSTAKLGQ